MKLLIQNIYLWITILHFLTVVKNCGSMELDKSVTIRYVRIQTIVFARNHP